MAALSVWIHVGQLLKAWTSSHSGTKKSHAKQGISIQRFSKGKYKEIKQHNNENNIASLNFPFFFPLKIQNYLLHIQVTQTYTNKYTFLLWKKNQKNTKDSPSSAKLKQT